MKIGIVNCWSAPWVNNMTGGLIYAMEDLRVNIRETGDAEATLPYALLASKKKSGMSEGHIYDLTELDGCDFLIFSNAGVGVGKPEALLQFIEQRVRVPFAVQFHHERETRELAETRAVITRNPLFKLALPIDEAIDAGADWGAAKRHVYPAFRDRIRFIAAPERPGREAKIVSTCRYTTTKRLLELARQAEIIGLRVEMYGPDINWRYVAELRKHEGEFLAINGVLPRPALTDVFIGARWHYNATSRKVGAKVRRVELATIEAVAHGCTPILHHEQKPDWVSAEMAVLVDPEHISRAHIVDSPADPRKFVAEFNKRFSNKTANLITLIKELINES